MSLADVLGGQATFERLHVTKLRPNPRNSYPVEEVMIDSIAEGIEKRNLLQNLIVYQDLENNCYILLSGETRYRAICQLLEENKHDGYVYVSVLPKPNSIVEENALIREANKTRNKTKAIRYTEIKSAQEEYEYLCSINQKPEGKKRDWIGKQIGISGRQVANILEEFEPQVVETTEEVNEVEIQTNRGTSTITEENIHKKIKSARNALIKAKEYANSLGCSELYDTNVDLLISDIEAMFNELF